MIICNSHKNTFALSLILVMLISCKNNFKEVQNIGILSSEPQTVAENINTKYTDSGLIVMNLVSPKMLNFSNRNFPYYEFPEGINLTIYDEDRKQSNVVSDYAILYDKTSLIDLQGNVVIVTHTKDTLFAEQLFYDQEREWLFTNRPVRFRRQNEIINGNGFDSDKSFKQARVVEVTGRLYIDE